MPDQEPKPPRHHLLIAGTGRAGTSFLVRWLAAAGLRTHLSAHDTPMWDDDANAGLEDLPVVSDWQTAPYVMKSPWLVEVIDEVLANQRIVLDGVIIPVRDLTEAAASRVVQELQTAHRRNPWMTSLGRSFEQWGTTPGGVVYSLDPVDQARLLAVSFHRLVQRLVRADVPIVLLDFPRLALDADYLFAKLRRFVPATIAQARAAHAEIADPDKIRVGRELGAMQTDTADPACEAHDRLDAVALRREVRRLTSELAEAERAATAHQTAADDMHNALETQAVELAGLAPPPDAMGTDRDATHPQVAALIATVEQRRAAAEQAAAAQQEAIAGLRGALDSQAAELASLVTMLEARDADRDAAQAQLAMLTATAERCRTDAEHARAEHQAAVADLRSALDARTTELAGQATTLAERDAALEAAQAQLATLTASVEQWRAAAEQASAEHQAARAQLASLTATAEQTRVAAENTAAEQREIIAGLRSALDARAGELAELAATLEARDADLAAAQLRIATLTTLAEQRRTEAAQAALAQQDEVAGLRSTLNARTVELAGLAATLAARDADLAAAQAQAADLRGALDARAGDLAELTATLEARSADLVAVQLRIDTSTALAEQRRAAAEHAAAAHQAEAAGMRSALDARAGEQASLTADLAARNAALDAAQAQIATLHAAAELQRAEAGRARAEHQSLVAELRSALDARMAELTGLATTLAARDADLQAAQAQIATLTASAQQLRGERDAVVNSWSWRAGRPLRVAGHTAQAMISTLRPGRRPVT